MKKQPVKNKMVLVRIDEALHKALKDKNIDVCETCRKAMREAVKKEK